MTKRTNRNKKKRKTVKKGGGKASDFKIGQIVWKNYEDKLHPDYNGKRGTVRGINEDSNLVNVTFDDSGGRSRFIDPKYLSLTELSDDTSSPEEDIYITEIKNKPEPEPKTNYIKIKSFVPTNPINQEKSLYDIITENN